MAPRPSFRVALAAALVVGVLVRLWSLRDVPSGPDGSSEVFGRLPTLVAGLVLIGWLPRQLERRLGAEPAIALAALLALAPPLAASGSTLFEGVPAALLGALAGVAFLRWWLCGSRVAAGLHVLFAALAVACDAGATPFVLAPWVFAAGDLCVRPRRSARPKWRQIGAVLAGLALAAMAVAPLGRTFGGPPAASARAALEWPQAVLLLLLGAACARGLLLLWRRDLRLAAFLLTLLLVQAGAAVALARGAARPVDPRDLLVALPVVLTWAAIALADGWTRVRGYNRAMAPGALLVLAPLAAALAACGDAASTPLALHGPARRVILITCDTLRADRLGAYGCERPTSPRLDAFAGDALLYEQAYTSAPVTNPALSSLMTGRLPDEIGVSGGNRRFMPPEVETLAEIARSAGLATGAVVSNWVLRRAPPEAGDVGLTQGFDSFDDRMTLAEKNRPAKERVAADTTDAAIGWLQARLDERRDDFFFWVHYQDPHGPYTPPDEIARRFDRDHAGEEPLPLSTTVKGLGAIPSYQALGDERRPGVYRDRYDAEIATFDEQLGRLLDFLSERALLDDSLVILTADHGEALGEHGYWFCHGETSFAEVVRVPFVVRFPRAVAPAPGRRAELVGHIDLFPTVLEALGLPARRTRGVSLLAPPARERQLVQTLGVAGTPKRWEGLTDGRWRLVVAPDGVARLYDVAADPREEQDVAAAQPERVAALRAACEKLLRSGERLQPIAPRVLSPEDEAALEALGYVGHDGETHDDGEDRDQ